MKAAPLCRWASLALTLLALALPSSVLAQNDPKAPATPVAPGTTPQSTTAPGGQLRVSGSIVVGEPAPDFDLWGSRNRELRLSRMRGDWVLLAFAERRESLAELAPAQSQLKSSGVVVLGVCHDKPQTVRAYAEKNKVPFEMLSDVTGEVSALYGLYDGLERSINPGFVVLDRQGIVRIAVLGTQLPADHIVEIVRFSMMGLSAQQP
jgi:peroxiredoxin Q/BCP